MNLRLVLLFRGVVGLLFVAYLLMVPLSGQAQSVYERNGYYAAFDGIIGMALWFAVSKDPPARWLSTLVLAEAVMRLVIGVFGLANPGIQSRVLGSVAYYGVIIVFCIVLGAIGMIYVFMKGRQPSPTGARSGALSAFIVSLATMLFGVAVIFGLPDEESRRLIVAGLTVVLGLTYLITGLRTKR
ncbi:hypothetical protein [Variovorax sp. Sphag1AA]|uniref:hypothetical protein n=1 Tax=Variovorax sp. Sphag1AA TaxID=2587027 RepID=UPI00160D61DA|nr:hypothetical protein [Variovorax sp. Sphag1AA]MBB3177214.1 hypothetical protein [Variovorax sp. Sphag1AA]